MKEVKNISLTKCSPFALQKGSFWSAKGLVLKSKRTRFEKLKKNGGQDKA